RHKTRVPGANPSRIEGDWDQRPDRNRRPHESRGASADRRTGARHRESQRQTGRSRTFKTYRAVRGEAPGMDGISVSCDKPAARYLPEMETIPSPGEPAASAAGLL